MTVLNALRTGVERVFKAKRLVLPYYVTSVALMLSVALPLRSVLVTFSGRSLEGIRLAHGISFNFVIELLHYNQAGVTAIGGLLVATTVIYWLVTLFLSGGAIALLARGGRYRPAEFWSAAARFFGRWVRLTLWSLPLLALLSLAPLTVSVLQRGLYGPDPYQNVVYWRIWLQLGSSLLALFLFRSCFDYARIDAILTDERRTHRSLWRGIRFTAAHLPATMGLGFLVLVLGFIGLAVFGLPWGRVDTSTFTTISAAVVLQQAYVIWRIAIRLARYGGYITLYRGLAQ